jgi:hypothetical protein
MASDFLKIASFANASEADQVRSVLEENGISAFVDGANASTALSYVGSALGGVRVLVRAADAPRATEIIEALGDDGDSPAETWFCGECQEEVDGDFQVCWSCGKERSEVDQPFPVSNKDRTVADRDRHSEENVEADDYADDDQSNPYAAPKSPTDVMTPAEQDVEIHPEAEAMLVRAWRASIIGLVFFPLIAHLYSMVLLIRASALTSNFSPEGRKLFNRALVVNVIAGCLAGIILTRAFG